MSSLRPAIGVAGLCASLAASASRGQQPAPTRPTPVALPVEQAVLVEGKPFPPVHTVSFRLPEARRTFFVAPGKGAAVPGKDDGDGTESSPWHDLGAALHRLAPGDRLRVGGGSYGPIAIDESCVDGNERQPIQLVFDGKATLEPKEGAPAMVVSRSHWFLVGVYARLGQSPAPGILFRGRGAHDLRLEGARVADGIGPGILVEAEAARIAITGAYVSKTHLTRMGTSSCGVEIQGGAREVSVEGSHLSNNPSGSIRARAPETNHAETRDLQIRENTIRDDGATAISIEAGDGVTIANNTLSDQSGIPATRGIALARVDRASVRSNRISGFAVGIAVGHAEPGGGPVRPATDVSVERNFLEGGRGAAAFVIEAGSAIRVVNNVTDGCANGLLLFGAPPQTERVVVANNLFLRVSDVALMMQSPSAATLFDYNVFSPSGPVTAEVGGETAALSRFLERGTMPHTQLKSGVRVVQRDLARVSGIATVDRGKAVPGLQFRGAAPDLGVAER